MKACFKLGCLAAMVLAVGLVAEPARSQQLFYDWIAGTADWNVDAHWSGAGLNFVPDANIAAGESARINNGGTPIVSGTVPRVAGLNVNNGTVQIQSNGVLETIVDSFGNGAASIGALGTIHLTENGQLRVAGPVNNAGTLRLSGPNTRVEAAGSFTSTAGVIAASITSPTSHGPIDVAGEAFLGGTLRVDVSGFTPSFGQSWDIVTAASLEGTFENVDVESSPPLARGLQYQVTQSNNTASLQVGNALILSVDRQSGSATISNDIGGPITITSYAILSGNGLLSPGNWTSFNSSQIAGPGWTVANPTSNHLAELNLLNSHSVGVGQSLALGSPYNGVTAVPTQEDLVFQYSTLGGQLHEGIVQYTGIANDLVVFVDPADGSAAIGNLSPFIAPPTVTGYAIRSASGQLTEGSWDALSDSGAAGPGWTKANPSSQLLAELNLEDSQDFSYGTLIPLGQIFLPNGVEDLTFEYSTLGGQVRMGTVQFMEIPSPPVGIPGDYNNNGVIDAADYTVWRDTLGQSVAPGTGADGSGNGLIDSADYEFWKAFFGMSVGNGSGVAAAAVPEPSAGVLGWLAAIVGMACRPRWSAARVHSNR